MKVGYGERERYVSGRRSPLPPLLLLLDSLLARIAVLRPLSQPPVYLFLYLVRSVLRLGPRAERRLTAAGDDVDGYTGSGTEGA